MSANLEMMSPFSAKNSQMKSRSRIEISSPDMEPIRHPKMFAKNSMNESISKFEIKFENNMNQMRELEEKVEALEQAKVELEKECVDLRRDKNFLDKENMALRKEKDFFGKMYKNCQQDITRIKETSAEALKLKESLFQSTISDLQNKVNEHKTRISDQLKPDGFALTNSELSRESFIGVPRNNSMGNVYDLHRKKLELVEKNMNRLMKDKRELQSEIESLNKNLAEKNNKIADLESQLKLNPASMSLTLLSDNEAPDDTVSTKRSDNSNNHAIKPVNGTAVDPGATEDPKVDQSLHQDCEFKYNEIFDRFEESESLNNQLTKKMETFALREIDLQKEIENLKFALRVQLKSAQKALF